MSAPKITLTLLLLIALAFITSCLGRTQVNVKKSSPAAIKGKRIFINYPLNNTANQAIANGIWMHLQNYFSPASKARGNVPMQFEANIKQAQIFLQLRIVDVSYNKNNSSLLLDAEISVKESYSEKYYLKQLPYSVLVATQNPFESYNVLEKKAIEKLAKSIAYYLQYKRLPYSARR